MAIQRDTDNMTFSTSLWVCRFSPAPSSPFSSLFYSCFIPSLPSSSLSRRHYCFTYIHIPLPSHDLGNLYTSTSQTLRTIFAFIPSFPTDQVHSVHPNRSQLTSPSSIHRNRNPYTPPKTPRTHIHRKKTQKNVHPTHLHHPHPLPHPPTPPPSKKPPQLLSTNPPLDRKRQTGRNELRDLFAQDNLPRPASPTQLDAGHAPLHE